ncbi:VOC family protein [Bradyrhizobium sp. F1.13.3]|jgi:methylmalonyl-CoA/ethylmalonyl-CoA epimerase
MDLHFHHLGMACRNIAAELPELAIVGYNPEGPIIEDPIQQVRIQFVSGGGPRLELIEPADAQSPVQGILKRGGKFYHLAYEVGRFDDAIAYFRERQYLPVSSPAPAVAFDMRRIVFLASATRTLIELIEARTGCESAKA